MVRNVSLVGGSSGGGGNGDDGKSAIVGRRDFKFTEGSLLQRKSRSLPTLFRPVLNLTCGSDFALECTVRLLPLPTLVMDAVLAVSVRRFPKIFSAVAVND